MCLLEMKSLSCLFGPSDELTFLNLTSDSFVASYLFFHFIFAVGAIYDVVFDVVFPFLILIISELSRFWYPFSPTDARVNCRFCWLSCWSKLQFCRRFLWKTSLIRNPLRNLELCLQEAIFVKLTLFFISGPILFIRPIWWLITWYRWDLWHLFQLWKLSSNIDWQFHDKLIRFWYLILRLSHRWSHG